MFRLFKKVSEKESLEKKRKKLLEESFVLSKTDRKAADKKMAEAEALAKKIESL